MNTFELTVMIEAHIRSFKNPPSYNEWVIKVHEEKPDSISFWLADSYETVSEVINYFARRGIKIEDNGGICVQIQDALSARLLEIEHAAKELFARCEFDIGMDKPELTLMRCVLSKYGILPKEEDYPQWKTE